MFQKSDSEGLSSNYFFLISNKSAHSIKLCLTVITALHATQTGASSFLKIKEYVIEEMVKICYQEIFLKN